jgi:hypothetical protein
MRRICPPADNTGEADSIGFPGAALLLWRLAANGHWLAI